MKLEFEEAKSLVPDIERGLKTAIIQFLQEPEYGYSPETAAKWSRVETDIKHDTDDQGSSYTAIYFEIGAELDYEGMSELLDKLNPIVQKLDSDAYFELEDPGISTCYIWYEDSEIESCQDITSAELPDYGGAFDIDPHEFFTKEECMELAEEVEDILNKDPDVLYPVQYYDVYIVDYNRIVVDLTDSQGNELSGQAKIDMRRIRVPHDLITKYSPIVADSVKEDIAYIYSDEIESNLDLNDYSEKIDSASDWDLGDTENPAVIDRLWKDESDSYREASDVKNNVSIDFDTAVHIYTDGEFDFDVDYNRSFTNSETGSTEWIDDETSIVVLSDSNDAEELFIDVFDDYAYTRFPMRPGVYKISGTLEVPYIITDLYEDIVEKGDRYEENTWGYEEDTGEVEFKPSNYTLHDFRTKLLK